MGYRLSLRNLFHMLFCSQNKGPIPIYRQFFVFVVFAYNINLWDWLWFSMIATLKDLLPVAFARC